MNDLASHLKEFLRALGADLTEKRVLPVVVLLVAAAIGIPIAFSTSSSSSSGAQVPPVVPAGPGAALAAVPPARQSTTRTHPLGRLHDPFAGGASKATAGSHTSSPITARPPTGATGPAGATPTPKPVSTGTTGPGGATGPGASTPLKPPLSPTSALELEVFSVDYSFGQGTNVKVLNDALRLDAVPSNTAPVAQFLGVTKDTKKAAFLIWGPATASGDGVCIDGQTPCQIVELKPGQTEFIDVLVPGAGLVQFELDVLAINTSKAATRAEALKAHMRQSADGIKVLTTSNASALAKFEYSTVYGRLLPRVTPGSATPQVSSVNSSSTPQAGGSHVNANSDARPSARLGSHRVHVAHGLR